MLRACVLPVLLYGASHRVQTRADHDKLKKVWRRACRSVLGWTPWSMQRHNTHHTDLFRKLKLRPLQQYEQVRLLSWAGTVGRMNTTRLPRRFLTSTAEGRRARGGGGRRTAPQATTLPTTTASHRDEGSAVSDGSSDLDSDQGSSDDDGASENETSDEDGEDASTGDNTPPPSRPVPAPPTAPDNRRYRVEYASSARSKCRATAELIPAGAVRVARVHDRAVLGGRDLSAFLSIEGLKLVVARDEPLRTFLQHGMGGLHQLRQVDAAVVTAALTAATRLQTLQALHPDILPVGPLPWTCNRCGKTYRVHARHAHSHRERDDCKQPRRRGDRAQAKTAPPLPENRAVGNTFLGMVGAAAVSRAIIPGGRTAGCAACARRKTGCQRCIFLRWMQMAQNPANWAKLVYRIADDDDGRAAQSRVAKWAPAESPWDPEQGL